MAWPGERRPTLSDAQQAYEQANIPEFASFKECVLAEAIPGGKQGAKDLSMLQNLLNAKRQDGEITYPIALFSSVPPTISHDVMLTLIDSFEKTFLLQMTRLCGVTPEVYSAGHRPRYLMYAMSCMGSVSWPESIEDPAAIWWHSVKLLVSRLELDNREARRIELLKAWVLLESYGVLTANKLTWRRTSTAHGYVETAVRRLVAELHEPQLSSTVVTTSVKNDCRSLVTYFVLIDLLRGIHFGQTSTLGPLDLPSLFSHDDLFRDIEHRQDNALLSLLKILAQIHRVIVALLPLKNLTATENKSRSCDNTNSQIPFSFDSEMAKSRRSISASLHAWRQANLYNASKEMAMLFHFGVMYLNFPAMQVAIELSGYAPRACDKSLALQAIEKYRIQTAIMEANEDLSACAWSILEISEAIEPPSLPVWAPLAVFCAGLVTWADLSVRASQAIHAQGASRVLGLFHQELTRMSLPCCSEMSRVLKNLRQHDSNPLLM